MDFDSSPFPKLTDRSSIVVFVKEVEKHPCLYNTSKSPRDRVQNRRAWMEIAKKLNYTVPECKEKWGKIRYAFMRFLKLRNSDNPPSRPYYLTNYLKFMMPENNKNTDNLQVSSPPMDCDENHIEPETKPEVTSEIESDDYNEINEASIDFNNHHAIYLTNFSTDNEETKREKTIEQRKPSTTYKSQDSGDISPRKMFLLSLLPDVESFSDSEMRDFRRGVITVIDNIIKKRDSD